MFILRPVIKSMVIKLGQDRNSRGIVIKHSVENSEKVKVQWLTKERVEQWENIKDLACGFDIKAEVRHVPDKSYLNSLGYGIVRQYRKMVNIELLLVEFPESHHLLWLPWQSLQFMRSVKHQFLLGDYDKNQGAERLRLRVLAWAIKVWNENTGALAELDIDPLPHQIHLVHHILASGNYNWLIADDVGLGKTIETGLLLHALRQRKEVKRVLLITPSGITQQWKEEMYAKFSIEDFSIYGDDFNIHEVRDWKKNDYVIASMDRIKLDNHLDSLLKAEGWDIIIVDEAHRFSRKQYGKTYETSQRYEMLELLRQKTTNIVLLSATPHQGREDSFVGLLELLRPERRKELLTLSLNPEILSDMMFRNYKADVTDIEGNFIFHGKTVSQITLPVSEPMQAFDIELKEYLRLGYNAELEATSNKGKAIGFVMTVYRKLASSSIEAIYQALCRRLARLNGQTKETVNSIKDERYQGEFEEFQIDQERLPFFINEVSFLENLIEKAEQIRKDDIKIRVLVEDIIQKIIRKNNKEKVLIFSEYRATQNWVEKHLKLAFGSHSTVMINGSMSLEDRRKSIDSFRNSEGAQFLISTEAGGEGINLQDNCHIMINYDLPWNPMRIVQRIGRLYRYGQSKNVVVFNIHQMDSADDKIVDILYKRLNQIVTDLSTVNSTEFNEAFSDDILGIVAGLVDLEDILIKAAINDIERTSERINEALNRAKEAALKQKDLFQYAASFDNKELQNEFRIEKIHLQSFVEGFCQLSNIDILDKRHHNMVWSLRLPENIISNLGIKKSRWDITFDRFYLERRRDLLYMSPENWLFKYFLDSTLDYSFKGSCSKLDYLSNKAFFAAILRWQNLRGNRIRQELVFIENDENQSAFNSEFLKKWLIKSQDQKDFNQENSRELNKSLFIQAENSINHYLIKKCSSNLLPEEPQWIAAGLSNSL